MYPRLENPGIETMGQLYPGRVGVGLLPLVGSITTFTLTQKYVNQTLTIQKMTTRKLKLDKMHVGLIDHLQ